jgi:hypothetical protein
MMLPWHAGAAEAIRAAASPWPSSPRPVAPADPGRAGTDSEVQGRAHAESDGPQAGVWGGAGRDA